MIFFRKLTYLFIWFIPIALNAAPSFFSEYQTPSVAVSGGVSVFKENSYESNYYNAAVTALVKRPLIGFSTIYSPSIQGYWSQIASPLSPGSLSLAYAHIKYFKSGDTVNRARFAYGKKYNDSFSAGLATVYSAFKSTTISETNYASGLTFSYRPVARQPPSPIVLWACRACPFSFSHNAPKMVDSAGWSANQEIRYQAHSDPRCFMIQEDTIEQGAPFV